MATKSNETGRDVAETGTQHYAGTTNDPNGRLGQQERGRMEQPQQGVGGTWNQQGSVGQQQGQRYGRFYQSAMSRLSQRQGTTGTQYGQHYGSTYGTEFGGPTGSQSGSDRMYGSSSYGSTGTGGSSGGYGGSQMGMGSRTWDQGQQQGRTWGQGDYPRRELEGRSFGQGDYQRRELENRDFGRERNLGGDYNRDLGRERSFGEQNLGGGYNRDLNRDQERTWDTRTNWDQQGRGLMEGRSYGETQGRGVFGREPYPDQHRDEEPRLYRWFRGGENLGHGYDMSFENRELGRRGGFWQKEPLTARDVMTKNVRTVTRQSTLRDVAQIMKDENCGIVPVVDQDMKLIGVLTDRDMVVRAFISERGPAQVKVEDVMTDDVECVTGDESLVEVIHVMGTKQIRRIPVVDRDDRLIGIISMGDIANRADYDEELQHAFEKVSGKRSFWSKLFA